MLEQSFQSNLFFLKVSLFYANYWGVDSVDASGKISPRLCGVRKEVIFCLVLVLIYLMKSSRWT